MHTTQGLYPDADPLFAQTTNILDNYLGPGHPTLATVLNNRAMSLTAQVRAPAGYMYYPSGGKRIPRSHFRGPRGTRCTALSPNYIRFGRLDDVQGRFTEADPMLIRAIDIREKVQGPEHQDLASPLESRVELLRVQVSVVLRSAVSPTSRYSWSCYQKRCRKLSQFVGALLRPIHQRAQTRWLAEIPCLPCTNHLPFEWFSFDANVREGSVYRGGSTKYPSDRNQGEGH